MTKFIPILSSQAGSCLTAENWQEVNVDIVSYELSSLLIKPGYDLLIKLSSLNKLVGWSHQLVLNASTLTRDKEGIYTLRSPYDGTILHYTHKQISELIIQLKPDFLILPEAFEEGFTLLESLFSFLPVEEYSSKKDFDRCGIYFYYDKKRASFSTLIQQLETFKHKPRYVAGDLNPELIRRLIDTGVEYVESNKPAQDAFQGVMYEGSETFSILSQDEVMRFQPLEENCLCPTCQQQFTRAYLHHLYENTPLLCQRMLIMHNQFHLRSD